jgi:hypothetical protein
MSKQHVSTVLSYLQAKPIRINMWTYYLFNLMFVPCIIRRSRNNQLNAKICTNALFYMLAPTCFGISLPSSGSFWIRLSYVKMQIDMVVYHMWLSGPYVGVSWFSLLCFPVQQTEPPGIDPATFRFVAQIPEIMHITESRSYRIVFSSHQYEICHKFFTNFWFRKEVRLPHNIWTSVNEKGVSEPPPRTAQVLFSVVNYNFTSPKQYDIKSTWSRSRLPLWTSK